MSVADTSFKTDLFPASVRALIPYWILGLVVCAVYGNVFDNVFLFDDDLLIKLDSNIRSWSHLLDIFHGSTTSGAYVVGGFYRPLQILLYLIAFQLGDGSTFPFHVLNLALHIANTCFMYRLGTKLGFKPWGVFLAALVWTVHPLHTEAITYMSATADPLFVFFCLWAIVILVPDITPRKIIAIIPLFLLGLISKETTVMFPLLVMCCLYLTHPQRLKPRTYLRTWPLWLITLIFVAWRMHAPGLDGPQTYARLYGLKDFSTLKLYADNPSYRIYTFFATLPAYLALLAWPTDLHMERAFSIFTAPWTIPVITGLGLTLLATTQIVRSALNPARGIEMGWGLLWFAAAHAPDSGILIPMNALFLEHWMYLPTVGLFLGTAETLAKFMAGRPRFLTGCSIAALVFAATMASKSYAQNTIWHDPASFYNNIFAYGERSARAHNNLALYYGDHDDFPDAIDQFKEAISISDTYAETRHNIALTYLRMSMKPENVQNAIDNLNRALELDPNFYRSYSTLGDIYAIQGDQDKAKYYHDRAAAIIQSRQ